MLAPSARCELAKHAVEKFSASIRLVCTLFRVSETCYHYQPKHQRDNALLAEWLIRLTDSQPNWGFGLCFSFLRDKQGCNWNRKRVYRVYRELQLNKRFIINGVEGMDTLNIRCALNTAL